MPVALTRAVSPTIERCELTHIDRQPIDVAAASRQHGEYEACLRALGCAVRRLRPEPELPDAVFVEDAAVVFDEVAVIARPGAPSRRAEVDSVAEALGEYRTLHRIEPPGTLDGGDVLRVGRAVYVGASVRTDRRGFERIREILEPFDYAVRRVEVQGCLHLKTAATNVAEGTLLVNPDWVDARRFDGLDVIEVDPREPFGANALRVGDVVVCPVGCPRTAEELADRGIEVRTVDISELAKAEGGVTCCSIFVEP